MTPARAPAWFRMSILRLVSSPSFTNDLSQSVRWLSLRYQPGQSYHLRPSLRLCRSACSGGRPADFTELSAWIQQCNSLRTLLGYWNSFCSSGSARGSISWVIQTAWSVSDGTHAKSRCQVLSLQCCLRLVLWLQFFILIDWISNSQVLLSDQVCSRLLLLIPELIQRWVVAQSSCDWNSTALKCLDLYVNFG